MPSQLPSRGHSKKLYKKGLKKDVRKFSFPHRAIDQWNILPEEVVCAKNIHKFKEGYDNIVLKDGTLRAWLIPVKIQLGKQLGKNTHTHT